MTPGAYSIRFCDQAAGGWGIRKSISDSFIFWAAAAAAALERRECLGQYLRSIFMMSEVPEGSDPLPNNG